MHYGQSVGTVLAIGTTFNYGIPFDVMLPLIKNAGFDTISVGARREHSGYHTIPGRKAIEKLSAKHKLRIDSIHAPLRLDGDISSPVERLRLLGVEAVENALDACRDLGVDILIIHLNKEYHRSEFEPRVENALTSMRHISDCARERGVRLALENLPEDPHGAILEETLLAFPDEHIGVCYDSSHAQLTESPFRILRRHGDRLMALHISDNWGESDDHVLPFEGSIDWPEFGQIFRTLDYEGSFLLEVEMRESMFKDSETFLRQARERGERLIELST